MMPKGNQKRETQQNSLLLPPARSEEGNEKRETQQNPMPLPPARSEKGNEKREIPIIRCPILYSLSNYC